MKKDISSRQFAILISISILTFKLTYFPSLLYDFAGKDGFWSFLILMLADLISFTLIMTIFVRHKDESFAQFLEKRIGKIASKIIYLILFIFFSLKLIYLTNVGYFFSKEAIFQEEKLVLFTSILFLTINALFLFKINSFARTNEFFYLFIIFGLIVNIVLGYLTSPDYGFLPLFEVPAKNIFTASWKCAFGIGDYLFILLFMGKVEIDKKFGRKLALYMTISFAILISFVMCFYLTFRYTGFLHQPAITDIVEFVPLSSVIENLDLLPTSIMLTVYVMHGGLFMFCIINMLKNTFKFKHKRYESRWLLLAVDIILIPLILLVFNSYDSMINISQTYFNWISIFCIYVIPLFCFIISFKKVQLKEGNNWAIKVIDENLKWISEPSTFKRKIALTRKIKFGGQKV